MEVKKVKYVLMDPSKNITALVLGKVPTESYEELSKRIMIKEPTVEQVGFLSFDKEKDICFRMAGGEFCGNATMSAAVYYCIANGLSKEKLYINVYGEKEKIEVETKKLDINSWEGQVLMPTPSHLTSVNWNGKEYKIVSFSNIVHVIIEKSNVYNMKPEEKMSAEEEIKGLCVFLNAPAMGFMYYESKTISITPLVYVKSVDTIFWESACASGSVAVGQYIFEKDKNTYKVIIKQPSGEVLEVHKDENKKIYLKGKVRFLYDSEIEN